MDSKNHWENQPRETNGQFGERPKSIRISLHIWDKVLKAMSKFCTKRIDSNAKGGSYGELRKETKGNKSVEIHHMPANSASELSRWKGPCIILEKEEHVQTRSHTTQKNSRTYRQKQKDLIEKGKFFKAEEMDIIDIFRIAGVKYSKALLEKINYDNKLYERGEIR